jgi:hypothetical protein
MVFIVGTELSITACAACLWRSKYPGDSAR